MQCSRQENHSEGGFFLTDVAVALFLLSAVSGAMLSVLSLARNAALRAEYNLEALRLSSLCLEETADASSVAEDVTYARKRSEEILESGPGKVGLVRVICRTDWTARGLSGSIELERIDLSHSKG
jgi:hypothetical protein